MNSIEGDRLALSTQKFHLKRTPPELKKTISGQTVKVYPFTLERRGAGTVAREFAPPPPAPLFHAMSKVKTGEEVAGEKLSGWCSIKPPAYEVGQSGRTAGHSGQSLEVRENCFLVVLVDFSHFPADPDPSAQLRLMIPAEVEQKRLG